ncbi:MAG TPA: DUF1080 domain-containing protein [Opitutaceae bacterium]|nr:DUF1080 domain-containing protein [Opitutaceae bacterium]
MISLLRPNFLRGGSWLLSILWIVFTNGSVLAQNSTNGVVVPQEKIVLFNGKDLTNFYTWLPGMGRTDPDRVFTVVDQIDGAPAIRVSGQHWGGFVTEKSYANYRLVAEFRWGTVTWDPRKNRARDSGILLHCNGEDGNAKADFLSPWIRSVEYQIIEGGTGDIILVRGYERGHQQPLSTRLTSPIADKRVWGPKGTLTEFESGRVDWEFRDPAWKDVLGFRGAKDVEYPVGKWNRIEVVCDGDTLDYFLNGVRVNGGSKSELTSGRLLFQSEGAEIFFRRIELHPLQNLNRSKR